MNVNVTPDAHPYGVVWQAPGGGGDPGAGVVCDVPLVGWGGACAAGRHRRRGGEDEPRMPLALLNQRSLTPVMAVWILGALGVDSRRLGCVIVGGLARNDRQA